MEARPCAAPRRAAFADLILCYTTAVRSRAHAQRAAAGSMSGEGRGGRGGREKTQLQEAREQCGRQS